MHPQAHMLTQACDYIEQHLDNTVKLDRLGRNLQHILATVKALTDRG